MIKMNKQNGKKPGGKKTREDIENKKGMFIIIFSSYRCQILIWAKVIWMFIDTPTFLCKPQSPHSFMILPTP